MSHSNVMELVEETLTKATPQDDEQATELVAELLGIGGDEWVVRTVNVCLTKVSAQGLEGEKNRIALEITIQDTTTLHSRKISKAFDINPTN
ncbi:hypothetical protein AC578_10926 [Pseudocercospora eumusae]|uniref:Uncharacterized protein n=1 Tax=Pseudocercospora eumusae TaxID=321146 RepID=A0A139GVN2_9PEZI|nr:hypothetical protein AC578_10926 [Pseudocercospora eumusae]